MYGNVEISKVKDICNDKVCGDCPLFNEEEGCLVQSNPSTWNTVTISIRINKWEERKKNVRRRTRRTKVANGCQSQI